jgi:hypothetical protein
VQRGRAAVADGSLRRRRVEVAGDAVLDASRLDRVREQQRLGIGINELRLQRAQLSGLTVYQVGRSRDADRIAPGARATLRGRDGACGLNRPIDPYRRGREPRNRRAACPAMPEKKPPKKKPPAKAKPAAKAPAKVGKATQLAVIQDRYRRALIAALDHPHRAQGDLIRTALAALLAEKAALGVTDGEEATEASE